MDTELQASTGRRLSALLDRAGLGIDALRNALALASDEDARAILDDRAHLDPTDFVALSDLLDVPAAVLSGRLPIDGHLGVSLRLGMVKAAADAPADALAYADQVLGDRALLDSWLGSLPTPLAAIPLSRDRFFKEAGRRTAERARDALSLGDRPIVDLVDIVESAGYPVAFRLLPEGIHGLNVRDQREGSISRLIVISCKGPWTQQRFTLGHELCHALYDDTDQVIIDRVDVPEVLPEIRAEAFARHFLLPPSGLAKAFERVSFATPGLGATIATLMLEWGVSRLALLHALKTDGLISEPEADAYSATPVAQMMSEARLLEQWRAASSDENAECGSQLLMNRALLAYQQGFIGPHVVARLIGRREEEITAELESNGWGGSAHA